MSLLPDLAGPYLWLIPAGFVIGAYGTLIGAGGGFILVPFLLLLYPQENPNVITSISLAVVFFNALSGSLAYARMRRIDYGSGILFSAATIPGAVFGALTTAFIPRRLFDVILGCLMVLASVFLALGGGTRQRDGAPGRARFVRTRARADGGSDTFAYDPILGVGLSLGIGYFSSVLGIGGGVIHVPVLTGLLNFPVHIATATTQFTLAIMALVGTLTHLVTGAFHRGVRRTIALTIGVLLGAQLGAWLSSRVRSDWIIRGLAVALGFLGIHVLLSAL